jgi:ADP-heptose:LPS heptosyltransferase
MDGYGFWDPRVWPPLATIRRAEELAAGLRTAGCKKLIAVNLGVGDNPRKQLGLEFEKKLLQSILNYPKTVVLLDKGFGEEELSRSASLVLSLQNQAVKTANIRSSDSKHPKFQHGLINIQCDIGEIAALISQCDEFIGYDSACQHIAAAAGTPTLTIFAGINNMNFIRRWSACGDTKCRIVHVDTLSNSNHIDTDEVISRIIEEITPAARPAMKQKSKIQEICTPGHGEKQAKTAMES